MPGLSDAPAWPPTPHDLFGPLFEAVQMRGLYEDGKHFADAVPRDAPAAIMRAYRARDAWDDAALRGFVEAHFLPPEDRAPPTAPDGGAPLRAHIAALWPALTRPAAAAAGSALALPRPYVVPGGRFRELYYWDSYFTMLGLAEDGAHALVEGMIANFGALIDAYGHIPNGTRTYYLGRSQPPVFFLMLGLSRAIDPALMRRRLGQLRREHDFWMRGNRVVALPDGARLNRYWDDRTGPREESWREDVATARASGRPAEQVWRDLRAGAESGWDFSSRWLGDGRTLATIRTTRIVPIDLNALLYGMERAIAAMCEALGEAAAATRYEEAADDRRRAIARWLWLPGESRFGDYDLDALAATPVQSAATFVPLFTGAASAEQAGAVARDAAPRLLAPGGLRTTLTRTGQQWDAPNGWAPLQWIAIEGLRRYGHIGLAGAIAERFLATVRSAYDATGRLWEKYDVEEAGAGGGGEYPAQEGFGWTNGVARALLREEAA